MQFSTLTTLLAVATAAIAAPSSHEARDVHPRDCLSICNRTAPHPIARGLCIASCLAMAEAGEPVEVIEGAFGFDVEEEEEETDAE